MGSTSRSTGSRDAACDQASASSIVTPIRRFDWWDAADKTALRRRDEGARAIKDGKSARWADAGYRLVEPGETEEAFIVCQTERVFDYWQRKG